MSSKIEIVLDKVDDICEKFEMEGLHAHPTYKQFKRLFAELKDANHSEEPLGVVEPTLADHCKQCAEVVKTWPASKRDCLGRIAAPVIERQEPVSDWAIDNSAGRPILAFKKCSVIEAEDAEYILGLVRRDRERQEPATYADKCDSCDKVTMGLSGSTKWCAYCGGKLTGETVPVEPMQIERSPAPVAVALPDGYMIVERSIWTEEQAESAAKCITMLKNVPGMTDRDLALAAMDAGQCKAPDITLADFACLDKVKDLNQ